MPGPDELAATAARAATVTLDGIGTAPLNRSAGVTRSADGSPM